MTKEVNKMIINSIPFYEITNDIKEMLLELKIEKKRPKSSKKSLKRLRKSNSFGINYYDLATKEEPFKESEIISKIQRMLIYTTNIKGEYFDCNEHMNEIKIIN